MATAATAAHVRAPAGTTAEEALLSRAAASHVRFGEVLLSLDEAPVRIVTVPRIHVDTCMYVYIYK